MRGARQVGLHMTMVTELRRMLEDRQSVAHRCPCCGGITPAPGLPEPIAAAIFHAGSLTSRERAVFRLLGAGYDNRSIARELHISERTVKRYVTAILTKLELRSRLQAGLSAVFLAAAPAASRTHVHHSMEES